MRSQTLAFEPKTASTRVRPLADADIPAIIEMRRRLFQSCPTLTPEAHADLFREVLLDNPWSDDAICSLVYEDDGRIRGFIGASTRRLTMNGRVYRAAVSQHLMVEPDSRSSFAAVELLRAFLSGPQDLSITDTAIDVSRSLIERLGGSTALAHSMTWWRRVQPATCALSELGDRPGLGTVAAGLAPIGAAADALLARRAARRFRPVGTTTDAVDGASILAACETLFDRRLLRPAYDARWLDWVLAVWAKQEPFGRLERVLVRGGRGEPLGWFVYFVNRRGVSEVLQIGATEKTMESVLNHLVAHARARGAVKLRGRLDPRFMKAYARREFELMHCGRWVLVHASRPELLQAIHYGHCFLSPLDGDLWFL